ncbi:MAG: type II secretion system F family protein [Phycisphaerae bacterium]
MPLYQYQALNQSKADVRGEITAAGPDEALSLIREQGLFPTSLKEKIKFKKPQGQTQSIEQACPKYHPEKKYFFRVSQKALIQFTQQFAQMHDAGLNILRSIDILEKQQRPGLLKRTLKQISQDVAGGSALADAMAKHPRVFDDLYVKMVSVGEVTGEMEKILTSIGDYKEKMLRLRQKVIRASIYPAFVIVFAIGIFVFIALVVTPMLNSAIQDTGRQVRGPLGFLSQIPGWFKLLLLPPLFWLGWKFMNLTEPGRYLIDSIKLKIPILGRIFYKIAVARFGRILGTLLAAGVPILEAIRITRDTTGNQVFARSMDDIHDSVREGHALTGLLKNSRLFDPVAVNMVEVGEETGDLDKVLLKLADNYEQDVDTLTGYLVGILEPILLIIMCLGVGGFVAVQFTRIYGALAGGGP